ncbi:hypothetical protein Bca101_077176 [Brassica carinata]
MQALKKEKVPLPSSIPAKSGGGTQKKMELRKAKIEGEQQFLFDQATTDKLRFHGVAAAVSQLRSVCRMLQVIYNEIFKGNMTKKLDAYNLLKIDPTKVH